MKISLELQPCLKNKSGVGVYTYELAKRLQCYKDLEITGDIFNFLNRNNNNRDLQGLIFNKSVCALFPYGIYRRIWHCIPIKYNNLFKEEVELTHFFNFIVPPNIKGKVINTIHDLTFMLYPDTMDKRNLKRITQDIQYSIERSSKIVTVSQSTQRDLINKLHIPEAKIEVIYPGVDAKKFAIKGDDATKRRIRTKYKLPLKYVLYMGTLEPRKNLESVIESFVLYKEKFSEKAQDIKLVIAGKKGWLYESIFERIKQLNIEEEVIFTDYIDENDKVFIYQLAEVFVFPSLYEGFGIPVLESMAAGTPVITSNVSSLPEVAGEAAVLVEPKDIQGIATGMNRIIYDKVYAEQLIQKGYQQVEKFSWEASAKKLYDLYQKIMEE